MKSLPTALAALVLGLALGVMALGRVGAQVPGPSIYEATLAEPDQRTGEVGTDELKQILANGSALVYDSRAPLWYAIGHIPGAVNGPKPGVQPAAAAHAAAIQDLVANKDAPIVPYCNGVFWPLSKRLGEALSEAGYTNVRRYQIGLPVWRALGGLMQVERDGIRYALEQDPGAVFIDARDPAMFQAGSLPGARNVPLAEVGQAMTDGRLPLADPGRRVVVFGEDGAQARGVAEALATRAALNNVGYFDGQPEAVMALAP